MSAPRVRIGIVGCGTITRNVHLPVLLALTEVEVAWVADTSETAGRALAEDAGVRFHQLEAASVSLPEAEIIALAIPNGARGRYYEHLAARPETGLYIEKPLARSIEEHRRIVAGREPSAVAVGLDRRSYGLTRLLGEVCRAEPFGPIRSARIEFGGVGRALTGGSFMSNAALAGGGTLYQMGVHFVDVVLFASGATDVTLRSGSLTLSGGLDIHLDGRLDVAVPSGTVPLDVLITQLRPTKNRIEIEFERAVVSFTGMYGEDALRVVPRSDGAKQWQLAGQPSTGPLNMFASFASHWTHAIDAFRTRRENYTSASQSTLTTKAIELLYSLPAEAARDE